MQLNNFPICKMEGFISQSQTQFVYCTRTKREGSRKREEARSRRNIAITGELFQLTSVKKELTKGFEELLHI